jgi:UDP-N-acetylmuramate: L-alanyl-gamma-D-glutamyl-meso-diaminopimelate ligase
VQKTLEALCSLHEEGRLAAVFEPRSATACRRIHQQRYAEAFDDADMVVIAPVGRDLPEEERLDTQLLAKEISSRGVPAIAAATLDEVVDAVVRWARPGDGVVLMSNGGFGGIGQRILELLK